LGSAAFRCGVPEELVGYDNHWNGNLLYGDILPCGATRLIAAVQGFLGFILAAFAIARHVAFLSKPVVFFGDGSSAP
jgi:hypothetical protein